MGITTRSDLVSVDILQETISAAFAGKIALAGTGAAIMSPTLPGFGPDGAKYVGGSTIRVPYFDSIGELDDITEGDALTPVGLSTTEETATIIHSGKAGEMTNWAQLAAQFADPYAEYGKQFATAWLRRMDANLITAAKTTTLVHDVSAEVGALAQISYNAMSGALHKWGDELGDEMPVLMVAHSDIVRDMRNLKDSTGRPLLMDSLADGQLPKFMGIPVKASDRLTATASVYPVLICRRGALAAWYNGAPQVMEDKDILSDSQITAIHTYHVAHLYKRPKGGSGTKPGVVNLKVKAAS